LPWEFSTGGPVLSAVAAHELEEKSSGVFVRTLRSRAWLCVVASAPFESLQVDLLSETG
jgi:hypothetical protein